MDTRLDKLPRWAREHINNLVAQLAALDASSDSPVTWRESHFPQHPLPRYARVCFALPRGQVEAFIPLSGDRLVIEAVGEFGELVVLPRSANVVNLDIR